MPAHAENETATALPIFVLSRGSSTGTGYDLAQCVVGT